ncbi:MAG TPA: ATP-binding protein [Bacteroidales bacterium]|nr:ATP-binding protein [Bacteroidales bacterium]
MKKPIKYRPYYFSKIEPFINDSLIKVLVGQRRVGKSYILKQLSQEILSRFPEAKILFINKEKYEFDFIKDYKDLISYIQEKSNSQVKTYLFIDEVQEIEQFELALRSLQSDGNFDIYCTGSNAKLLSGELATALAGRYVQFHIHSLTYKEFLDFHELSASNETLYDYIKYGGMPHLVNLRKDESVYYEYLKNIYDSIILRDVVARYNIRNVHFLQNLIEFLADNVGSIVSAKKISDYLKSQQISLMPQTVLDYLVYLESVFYIERVKRKEIGGKKIFEIGDKFYFEDLGMRHALIPFQQKDINKVLENLVFHHLRANGYKVFIGKMDDKEVDFIAEKQEKITYIQVAYMIMDEKTHEREFGNLLKIPDNNPKYVISMDEFTETSYKGIFHWSIMKFLLEFE